MANRTGSLVTPALMAHPKPRAIGGFSSLLSSKAFSSFSLFFDIKNMMPLITRLSLCLVENEKLPHLLFGMCTRHFDTDCDEELSH